MTAPFDLVVAAGFALAMSMPASRAAAQSPPAPVAPSAQRTLSTPAQTLVGLDGTSYPPGSTVTLAPFASIVLLRP